MAALKGAGNIVVTYNGNAATNYTNSTQLNNTVAELEATHLGSTAEEADPGLPGHTLDIGGDWNPTVDGYFGADAMAGIKRTASVAFDDGTTTVTYTWTSEAFITNWQVGGDATGKLVWTAQLRLSGAGVRSVSP